MTLQSFGRATPIQMDLLALVGYEFVDWDLQPATSSESRKREMRLARERLQKDTEVDFGYDVMVWRELLIEFGDEFGYTHPYAFDEVDRAVLAAMEDPEVVADLEWLALNE